MSFKHKSSWCFENYRKSLIFQKRPLNFCAKTQYLHYQVKQVQMRHCFVIFKHCALDTILVNDLIQTSVRSNVLRPFFLIIMMMQHQGHAISRQNLVIVICRYAKTPLQFYYGIPIIASIAFSKL